MTTPYRPLLEIIRQRFPILAQKMSIYPEPKPKATTTPAPKIPVVTPGTMKRPESSPIKTFGTGLEKQSDVYGAVEISPEQVKQNQIQTELENKQHEKELAPVKSYNQGSGSPPMNGFYGTDPSIIRSIQQWENEQRSLFAPFKIGEIRSSSPIKMQNLRPAGER